MENYNETGGENRNDRNNGSIRNNNQENLKQQRNSNNNSQQEQQEQDSELEQDRKRIDVKDMPELKPEINQTGI